MRIFEISETLGVHFSNFELLYPTPLDTIEISINTDETIPFEWEESSDVDSEVSYNLTLTFDHNGNSYTSEYDNILDTNYAISAYEYAILMTNLNLAIVNVNYIVEATDGEFTVVSDSGKFVFSNISLLLKIILCQKILLCIRTIQIHLTQ